MDVCVQYKSNLHSELQASQVYIERPCLKESCNASLVWEIINEQAKDKYRKLVVLLSYLIKYIERGTEFISYPSVVYTGTDIYAV